MFDYSQLEALLAIEREGSIDGAARSLGISASAVSQRIKVLEERVGAITVNRQKPARTTNFGSILCRHAEQVILLENTLIGSNEGQFAQMARTTHVVGVAMDQASVCTWFIEAMKAEASRSPSVLYDIKIVESSRIADLMKQGSALAAVSDAKETVQGYRSQSLGSQTYMAVMTPEYGKIHFPRGVDAETIQQCSTIRRCPDDNLYREWLSQNFGFELELNNHIIPSSEAILATVRNSIAWSMIPKETAEPYLQTGELVELIPESKILRPIYWHYCRAISDALKPLTESVQKVALRKLHQKPMGQGRISARVHHSKKANGRM